MSAASTAPLPKITRIRPPQGVVSFGLAELWEYRELLLFLAWRDIRLRYKEAYLGAAWALLQPLLTMFVFTMFFGRLAGIRSDGTPYPVWSYCGLLPWSYFSYALTHGSNSLVTNRNLLKKVYFPRLLMPMSCTLAGLLDLAVAMLLLVVLMFRYHLAPTGMIIFLPLLVLVMAILAMGISFWLSALNIEYRDVQYTLPFLTQIGMFLSPVAYPASLVPETKIIAGFEVPLRTLYGLNPMAGVIEGFRWCLLGQGHPPGGMFWVALMMTLVVFVTGLAYFRRMEKNFADVA